MDERREASADIDGGVGVAGEEIAVAPEAGGAGADALAGDVAADGVVVVGDFDGAEAELADVARFEGVFAMTFAAAKVGGEAHAQTP